ncbi:MAG: hypothetical protein IKY83_10285 [Proteobacteria bacterium]|nr:hypothetical protein [Pseudomonadota bacterium]
MKKKLTLLAALIFAGVPAFADASPYVYLNGVDITGTTNQTFVNVTVQFDALGNVIMTAPHYHLMNTDKNHQANGQPVQNIQQAPYGSGSAPSYGNNPALKPSAQPSYGGTTAPSYGNNPAPSYGSQAPSYGSQAYQNRVIQPASTFSEASDGITQLPEPGKPTYLVAFFDSPGLLGYNVDVYINGKFIKTMMQSESQTSFDITQYLVKGKNTLQYQMSMAADAGSYSKASVVLSLSKLTARQGNAIELTGQYARQYIRASDGPRLYQVEVFVP